MSVREDVCSLFCFLSFVKMIRNRAKDMGSGYVLQLNVFYVVEVPFWVLKSSRCQKLITTVVTLDKLADTSVSVSVANLLFNQIGCESARKLNSYKLLLLF